MKRRGLTHTQNYGLPLMIPREGETLAEAIERVLGRPATLDDLAKVWGAPGDQGRSIVDPGRDHLGRTKLHGEGSQ